MEKLRALAQRRLSRRGVLGATLAAGAGVAALRLMPLVLTPSTATAGSGVDWISPLGAEAARVNQLLRRTTFGASPPDLAQSVSAGYEKTVERLLDTPAQEPPTLAGAEQASRTSPIKPPLLQSWWLDHMLATPTPFAERMTLFWHGHFTSDYRKVGLQSPYIYWQNLTWRRMALTDLRSMLLQVTVDPGMLRYLDLGTSTGANPNENYSRELMELFTMGAGSFTEDDVRAAARALAGWRLPLTPAMVQAGLPGSKRQPAPDSGRTGIFLPRRAYSGDVTLLGQTGHFHLEAVVERILAQPVTAPLIVGKLLQEFVSPQPDPALVKQLADRFRSSGYDVKALVRDMLLSPAFTAAGTYRALVKSPTEYMVSAARLLQAPQLSKLMALSAPGMGQSLFDPPDVSGWPSGGSWISSSTVLSRVNFATAALGQLGSPPSIDRALTQVDHTLSPQTAALVNQAADDPARWFLLLASPEFQLK